MSDHRRPGAVRFRARGAVAAAPAARRSRI